MIVPQRRSLAVILCTLPVLCFSLTAILASTLLLAGSATALPLCQGAPDVRCREEVEAGINVVIESLRDGAPNVDDQQSGISTFLNALRDFAQARTIIMNIDLPVTDRCKTASDADEQALHRTAVAVAKTSNLRADQFISEAALTATHTALTALVSTMIDAVDNNLNEIEAIGKGFYADPVSDARNKLSQARNQLAQDQRAQAADEARIAYNIVDTQGNAPPLCAALVRAPCPGLPNPASFPGDTEFNNTIRSQMWITNDGLWWGAFADVSSVPPGVYFYRKGQKNFVQGPLIDEAVLFEDEFVAGKPDTIWNGSHLFILIYTLDRSDPLRNPPLARLYKYEYALDTQQYSLLRGFPIDLPLSSNLVTDIAFDQDSTGRLWATYTDSSDGTLHVIWSTSSDHMEWDTDGTILASGLATDTEEASTIVHFGANQIGVVWSNQALGEIGFRFHQDGLEETLWSPKEIIDCCDRIPGVADNHLSLRGTPLGRLILIAKNDIGDGQLHLYERSISGVWEQKTIVDPDPFAAATRPTLLLDLENQDAYVIYRDSNKDGVILFVQTNLLGFPDFSHPCPFINRSANSPTSTKQPLDSTTGLIAAASGDDLIFWTSIDLAAHSKHAASLAPTFESATPSTAAQPQIVKSQQVKGTPTENYGAIWPNRLSRSATPKNVAQWRWLRAQGVNAVVTLDQDRINFGKFGIEDFLWVPLNPGEAPTNAAAERILQFLKPDHLPVHLQSAEGYDCMATIVAVILYAIDGQPMEAALAEARRINAGQELSPAQVAWLQTWAADHPPGSHRRR